MPPNTTPQQAQQLLQIAQQAATAGNAPAMLGALSASGYLDGLVRRLRSKWHGLPVFEVEDCVVRAVDSAYAFAVQGGRIRELGAWLWKTADNIAFRRNQEYETRGSAEEAENAASELHEAEAERAAAEELLDRRSEAIRLIRQLIPQIGTGQIVDVLQMAFDAAIDGEVDLPPSEIGDALGISAEAVRSLLSRGFRRLRKTAEKNGISFPDEFSDPTDEELEE
jgi:DNA-directed RNA polymerase specialized sigma24 family protein